MTVEILSMYNLMPMRVRYSKKDLESQEFIAFLDFVNEKVYWDNEELRDSEVDDEIIKIIRSKKEKAKNIELPVEVMEQARKLRGR